MEEKGDVAITIINNLKNKDSSVRRSAIFDLARVFPHSPDRELATEELLAMTKDNDQDVRRLTARTIGEVFVHITQKEKATKELISLTKDEDVYVRMSSVSAISSAFVHLTDKENVIKHLLSLTESENSRYRIEEALRLIVIATAFEIWSSKVLNMGQIIRYLLEFTKNESRFNRFVVVDSDQDWKTLLESVKDDTKLMDKRGFHAAFVQVSDKEQALKDIIALMKDANIRINQNAFIAFVEILTPTVC